MDARLWLRWLSVISGPELVWLLIYVVSRLLAKASHPSNELMNELIKSLSIIIPAVAALPFLLWYVPYIEKRWLLPRIWLSGGVGAHFALATGVAAYRSQGHQTGTMYVAGMVLTVFVLLVGSLFVQLRFRSRHSGRL